MPADPSNRFQSVLSAYMENFLQEKHACGYAYREQTRILQRLDDFLGKEGLARYELPVSITRKWLAKKENESEGTNKQRIVVTGKFQSFWLREGYSAYFPDSLFVTENPRPFVQ